jgi:DNA helicase HerA-like ATPase
VITIADPRDHDAPILALTMGGIRSLGSKPRMLVELARWASRHPSPRLQALVLLDEADIYLSATSKPATKQPTQELLRRGRSAGLGVLLATQSPGDFDYKCRDNIRTWCVGRVAEKTAVDKMKPLLGDYRGNPAAKLVGARTGEFFVLADGEVSELKAHRSAWRRVSLPKRRSWRRRGRAARRENTAELVEGHIGSPWHGRVAEALGPATLALVGVPERGEGGGGRSVVYSCAMLR